MFCGARAFCHSKCTTYYSNRMGVISYVPNQSRILDCDFWSHLGNRNLGNCVATVHRVRMARRILGELNMSDSSQPFFIVLETECSI